MEIWQQIALKNISDTVSQSGLSQSAFAKKVKLNPNHFNMVMNRKRAVTRQLVTSIATELGLATDWFYQDHTAVVATALAPDVLNEIKAAAAEGARGAASSDLSPEKQKLIALIRDLPDSRVRTLLDVLSDDIDASAVLDDESETPVTRRRR